MCVKITEREKDICVPLYILIHTSFRKTLSVNLELGWWIARHNRSPLWVFHHPQVTITDILSIKLTKWDGPKNCKQHCFLAVATMWLPYMAYFLTSCHDRGIFKLEDKINPFFPIPSSPTTFFLFLLKLDLKLVQFVKAMRKVSNARYNRNQLVKPDGVLSSERF